LFFLFGRGTGAGGFAIEDLDGLFSGFLSFRHALGLVWRSNGIFLHFALLVFFALGLLTAMLSSRLCLGLLFGRFLLPQMLD
jgi:hypothetical protein